MLIKILATEWKNVSFGIFHMSMEKKKSSDFNKRWKEINKELEDIEKIISMLDDESAKKVYYYPVQESTKKSLDKLYHEMMCE